MENKAHALAAGIFVVVMAVLLVLLAAWLTRDAGDRDRFEISTRETVTGLQEQAPVRLRGVDVGKVTAIGFDPKVQGNVLLRLDIEAGAPITRETFATLAFQGVTGLAFVQLDDSGQPAARLEPNDEAPPRIPLRPGLLSKITEKGEVILDQVEQITVRMNQMLADPNQKRIASALENVGQAAAGVTELSKNFNTIMTAQFGPREVNIPKLVRSTEQAVSSLRATSEEARAVLGEVGKTAQRLNAKDGPVDRLAEGTEALSHAADAFNAATLPRINQATEDTSRAVRQLSRTVNTINDNPQSLIFGSGRIDPGPGEPGFTVPGGAQ